MSAGLSVFADSWLEAALMAVGQLGRSAQRERNHKMKRLTLFVIAVALSAVVHTTKGSTNSVITSLHRNGELTFTPHPFGTNYWVEWAPTVSGPWTNS
jgi:hypothetical protein